MSELPAAGLHRTTKPMPGREADFPTGVLVFVGTNQENGHKFVVRPGRNVNNRWLWGEPTTALVEERAEWAKTSLRALPTEGYYTLPKEIEMEGGGRWLENAIVQLGYNGRGEGILFIAERREGDEVNALYFSDKGMRIDDDLLGQLRWAPYLPVDKGDSSDA